MDQRIFFHFNDTCFLSRRLLFDNLKSTCSSILLTFYKNLIFEIIPLFSNSATIYILWFCSITLPLKELDLGLSECMISSNDQIGKILSWEKTGGLRQTAKRPSLIGSQNLGVHNSIQSQKPLKITDFKIFKKHLLCFSENCCCYISKI